MSTPVNNPGKQSEAGHGEPSVPPRPEAAPHWCCPVGRALPRGHAALSVVRVHRSVGEASAEGLEVFFTRTA